MKAFCCDLISKIKTIRKIIVQTLFLQFPKMGIWRIWVIRKNNNPLSRKKYLKPCPDYSMQSLQMPIHPKMLICFCWVPWLFSVYVCPIWKDVFGGDDEQPLEHKFDIYGKWFLDFNLFLRQQPFRFRFTFSSSQQKAFNAYFEQTQLQYLELCGDDYVGSIRRLGLIAFCLAMIMTALRIIDTGRFIGSSIAWKLC